MYAAPAPMPLNPIGRKRVPVHAPVGDVDVTDAQPDDEQHYGHLDHHDRGVEARALFNPNHQDRGDHQSDDERRKVKADLHPKNLWRVHQVVRPLQEFRRVARS